MSNQRYEYKLVWIEIRNNSDPSDNVKKLNKLAKRGWRAVGMVPKGKKSFYAVVLMERPK